MYFSLVLALHAVLFLTGLRAEAQERHVNAEGCQQQFATRHLAEGSPILGYSRAVRSGSDLRRMHAVLVWGGDSSSPRANYVSHWNDLSFIYVTLRNLGLSPSRIHVLVGAGRTPRMRLDSPSRVGLADPANRGQPFPTDLDCDGENDIDGPGTASGLRNAFLDIADVMGRDDRIIITLIGHGNRLDTGRDPFETTYQLWHQPSITAREFKALLDDTLPRDAHIGVIATSCDSGGFITVAERRENRCVITSAYSTEVAYTGGPAGYTTMYSWVFGLFGGMGPYGTDDIVHHDRRRRHLTGDDNRDGTVSFAEAFESVEEEITSSTPQIEGVASGACGDIRF